MPNVLNYRVIVEQDEDGVYVASVPALSGCYTEGDTFEETIKNITDVIKLRLQSEKKPMTDDSASEFVGIKTVRIPYGIPSAA